MGRELKRVIVREGWEGWGEGWLMFGFFSIYVLGVSKEPIVLELVCMCWRRYVGGRTKNMTAGGMGIQS